MGEIRLSHCCRLCLKEGFTLTNIFSQRSAAGDPLYQILNFIYEMKIFENDGLPSQICSPCMWRMIEFDACKKNVRSAEAEILRLLSQTRPVEPSEVDVAIEQTPVNSEVSIKEEIDIVEWEMPTETAIKVPEAAQHFQEANEDDYNDLESDNVEPVGLPEEEYKEIVNEEVFSQPLKEFSETSSVEKPQFLEDLRLTVGDECLERSMESTPWITEKSGHFSSSRCNRQLTCDVCKKRFTHKYLLLRHERTHYPDRPFSCNVCNKRFKHENVRKRHELLHMREIRNKAKGTKKNKFTCHLCGKNFSTSNGLHAHFNQHSNRYACRSCGKSFGTKSGLENHSRVHTKERPYECQNCLKSFNVKTSLTRHMVTHSPAKPFACDVCKRKFKTKERKKHHELVHLKIK